MSRRLRLAAVAAALGAVGTAAAVATPASAHNYLVSSTPAEGETLTEQPGEVVLTTNDNLLNLGEGDVAAGMRVVGPDGLYYGDGCVSVVGPEASMPLELGPAGEYTLTWQVVSTDGHPVSDEYAFAWEPSDPSTAVAGSESVPDCDGTATGNGGGTAAAGGSEEESPADPSAFAGDLLWIGGALAAVVGAVGVTLLLLRRPGAGSAGTESGVTASGETGSGGPGPDPR